MENFKEIESMLSFLDDTDPGIRKQIEENLSKILVEDPKKFFEIFDKFGANNVVFESMTQILIQTYGQELADWRKKDFGKDLLKGWLLISKLLGASIDEATMKNKISRFANLLWLQTNHIRYIQTKAERLYKLLTEKENYEIDGSCSLFLTPECISAETVFLQNKAGGLAFIMLFYLVFRKLGIDSQIVKDRNFYFLRFVSHNENFYLSSLPGDLIIPRTRIENTEDEFSSLLKAKPLSHIYVILEIIEHLIFYYSKKRETHKELLWKKIQEVIDIKM